MKRTEVIDIINGCGLSPNKRLGQNFLVSDIIADRITESVGAGSSDILLEIGPGLGALTGRLLEKTGNLTAVEIDSGLAHYLDERFGEKGNFTLIHGDFLKEKIEGDYSLIVSNLPYYCTSDILFKLAGFKTGDLFLMIQRELADRITASPGQKSYGALSVSICLYFEPKTLFNVPRDSFYPRPDVISSFMRFKRRKELPLPDGMTDVFHRLVKSAFWGRRKTILKALSGSPHIDISRGEAEGLLEMAGIDCSLRGETLGLDDYVNLACKAGESGLLIGKN